jgi:hypothetical protein
MSRASDHREGRGWPGYLVGGRIRTSTVVLLVAFLGIWWLFETYQPAPAPPAQVPATEVVPPGFIPDPSYTWVPRTDVQRPTPTTTTVAPTTTESTTPTEPTSAGEQPPASPTPGEPVPPGPPPAAPAAPVPPAPPPGVPAGRG